MPCSAALVVVFSFVSAVVGVLLVVPVTVSAWSVVARSEAKTVCSVVAGVSRTPYFPCIPRLKYLLQGEAACRAEEVLYLEVWPQAWAAWWHTCSSLVVWAYRREVEVARELLSAVEDLEEGAHAPACCAECSGCGLVCFLNCTWASGAVEPLLSLQASCVLGVVCLQYRLQLRSDLFAMP